MLKVSEKRNIDISLKDLSDEELFLLLQNDDNISAFNILYTRYSKKVFSYCLAVFRDEDKAKDIFQIVMTSIFEKKQLFKGGSFIAWLMIITRNQCLMEKRNTKNNVEIEKYENYLVHETQEQDVFLREKIKEIVETLGEDYKEVIELRYYSDFTYDEIAETLNISESLVKVRLFRAKNLLIKKMEMFKGYINE